MTKKLKSYDMFGPKIDLMYDGKTTIPSVFGAIVSLCVIIFVFGYSAFRTYVMVTYGATTAPLTIYSNFYANDYAVKMGDDLSFAFGVINPSNSSASIFDPSYLN